MRITKSDIEIIGYSHIFELAPLPLIALDLPATYTGFPSPAEEYTEAALDLNQYLVSNPPATFFAKVGGDSLIEDGIFPGDIAVIDRSIGVSHLDRVVAVLNGEMTLKVLSLNPKQLQPRNRHQQPIDIKETDELALFGVLKGIVRKYK